VVDVSGMLDPESDAEDVKGTGEWTDIWLLCYVNFFFSLKANNHPSENPKERVR
jgi:hypothetical protein